MSSTTLPVCPKTGSTSPSLTVHLCLHTALLREIGNAPISDTLRSNWVADRKPPEPKLATVKAHQSNRRVVQKLISEALRHQDKRPIWNGTPYQTRITGFTLTAAGE